MYGAKEDITQTNERGNEFLYNQGKHEKGSAKNHMVIQKGQRRVEESVWFLALIFILTDYIRSPMA